MEPIRSCECALCRTVRRVFLVTEGNEYKIVGKLIDLVNCLSETVNMVGKVYNLAVSGARDRNLTRAKIFRGKISSRLVESLYSQFSKNGVNPAPPIEDLEPLRIGSDPRKIYKDSAPSEFNDAEEEEG